MARAPVSGSPSRRARRSFWMLLLVAVLAAGSLSSALEAAPGPLAGLRVAGSGIVLVVAVTLAARVMVGVERARRRRTMAGVTSGRGEPTTRVPVDQDQVAMPGGHGHT